MHRSILGVCDAQRVLGVECHDVVDIGAERQLLIATGSLGEQLNCHKRGIFDIDDAFFGRRSEPI